MLREIRSNLRFVLDLFSYYYNLFPIVHITLCPICSLLIHIRKLIDFTKQRVQLSISKSNKL